MPASVKASSRGRSMLVLAALLGGVCTAGVGAALLIVLLGVLIERQDCGSLVTAPSASITLLPGGGGTVVGATEYGGPGDPSSGITGARGDNLLAHPDSYAELGGLTWPTATAMGGLSYMTALRVSWGNRSAIAYKRDFGLGGGPVAGLRRAIDLWWQLAGSLGIPYSDGRWSGPVRVQRPPESGSGSLLGGLGAGAPMPPGGSPPAPGSASPSATGSASPLSTVSASPTPSSTVSAPADCAPAALSGVSLTPGPRGVLLPSGAAAAPAGAPAAVAQMIEAGNQIVGKPYVYGGAHGLPLSEIAPGYDCSSSVEHLLYGARLVPLTDGAASSELESFGAPGPGRWVTLYASAEHVFMYVAGLRWDTHDAAGAGDGSTGIGWHPLVRSSAGFLARHPVGL